MCKASRDNHCHVTSATPRRFCECYVSLIRGPTGAIIVSPVYSEHRHRGVIRDELASRIFKIDLNRPFGYPSLLFSFFFFFASLFIVPTCEFRRSFNRVFHFRRRACACISLSITRLPQKNRATGCLASRELRRTIAREVICCSRERRE